MASGRTLEAAAVPAGPGAARSASAGLRDRLALYRLLDSYPGLSTYRAKLVAAVAVAALAPALAALLVAMIGVQRIGVATLTLLFVILALAGAVVGAWLVDRLLAPLVTAIELLDAYAERRDVARVDIGGTDSAAQIVRGVQSLVAQVRSQDAAQRQRDERDEATGLYGRRAGRDKAQALVDAQCKLGRVVRVVCVRIDRLGAFNDAHGYGHGEALLKVVAARVARVAGDHGVAMRWGGDEFVLVRGIAPHEPPKFEQSLGRSIVVRGAADPVTLSLGAAQTDVSVPFDVLAARASDALAAARREHARRTAADASDAG